MADLITYCRITGNSRNLPKPCYFPMLAPITPADAKKMCRVTRYAGKHNYSPIIAFAKPIKFDGGVTGCSITKFKGFGYFRPKPIKELPNDENLQFYKKLLDSMKSRSHREVSPDTSYIYQIPNLKKCIVLPGELEEAIRTGEVESLGLSENNEHISIKIKEGRSIKIGMESVEPEVLRKENISQGEGPSAAVIEKQMKIVEENNKRKQETIEKRKLFEDKDKKAEQEDIKSKERPASKKPKVVVEEPENKEIPKMESDVQIAEDCALEIDVFESSESDIHETTEVESSDWDSPEEEPVKIKKPVKKSEVVAPAKAVIPQDPDSSSEEEIIEPVKINKPARKPAKIADTVSVKKVQVAASVKPVKPVPKVSPIIVNGVTSLPKETLKETQHAMEVVSEMDYSSIPSMSDISSIVSCSKEDMTYGYVFKTETGTEFVSNDDESITEEAVTPGVMMPLENKLKFIPGQMIKLAEEQSFVAGQTVQTSEGLKFVPGLTVKNESDEITFIPGTTVSDQYDKNTFVCGRIVEAEDNEFVPGQYVDIGKEKEIFTPGQTVVSNDGLQFLPGETISDEECGSEFVPGIKLESKKEEKFVPGQVFSSDKGLKFTPGQIIDTNEGPSFILGKSMKTPDKRIIFVKGKTVINEYGEVCFENQRSNDSENGNHIIPNKNLHPVADANGEIISFNIKPTNTRDLNTGERLYGYIVETENSVRFYTKQKLPDNLDSKAKIISGELQVGQFSQKFIPGRLMKFVDGEKFIPGQVVTTNNGEEFVPGKIVEGTDGPKFVPGQVIKTEEGEKFVPGQVITNSEGPRFVPGQIIETEHGSTFIPGQMMNTDKGRKFVPGQLIDTKEGPRFVPGQVIEGQAGPKFLPGLIVETDEGVKYVPSETDDQEEDMEFTFQGFDITAEELLLLSTNIDDSDRHSPVTGENGLINSATFKKLSRDNMVVHGRTVEPKAIKKAKSNHTNVSFLSANEVEDNDDLEDCNFEKVKILKGLIASQATVSNNKKQKELKKVLNILGEQNINQSETTEAKAIGYIISSTDNALDIVKDYIGNDDQLIQDILGSIGNTDSIHSNGQTQRLFKNVMKGIVTKRCNDEIENIIDNLSCNPDLLFTDHKIQMLLAEAVGIVCITGDIEAASLLEQFISEPNDPSILREDKDVLEVLKQLVILHEVAKRNANVGKILHALRKDPANFRNKNEVFSLLRQTKLLLRKESAVSNAFNLRHIASSKDIPTEMFEQLKDNKREAEKFIENLPDELFYAILGDERCGEKLLDSLNPSNVSRTMREIEKFKNGMAIVVVKENMQAVIPRTYARSVYYGIMPYILIDEEGFKFYERGLTGRKLSPSKVIKNTWYGDDDEDESLSDSSHHSQFKPEFNKQYSVVLPGMGFSDDTPCLQYTSLLSSSGPTRLPYYEASRRASRDGSVPSSRLKSRSVTPSRRSSTNSIYDSFSPLATDSYSRRGSNAAGSISVAPTLSTISHLDDLEDTSDVNNYTAVVPYQDYSDEEGSSIRRSDTVANLLDKYSNFSVEREFAKPLISSKSSKKHNPRYKSSSDYTEDDEDGQLFPLGGNRNRSLATPDKERTYLSNGRTNHSETGRIRMPDKREIRRLRRPISDIFETDELDAPIKTFGQKKSLPSILPSMRTRDRKHFTEESDDEEEPASKYSLPVLSYSPRNRKSRKDSQLGRDFEPYNYSRRLSEPRMTRTEQSGNYRVGKFKPSRSVERDLIYSSDRDCKNGDHLYGNTRKNNKTCRYQHIEDPVYMGHKSVYDPNKPYNSNYLDMHEFSDDEEERPSYQLLGRSVQTPSRVKGHGWQTDNLYGSIAPRSYNTGPAINHSKMIGNSIPTPYDPGRHMNSSRLVSGSNINPRDPRMPYCAYDNNVLRNLNYEYEGSSYFPTQNYLPKEDIEQPTSISDSYTDPKIRNLLNRGDSRSYRDKYSPNTINGRKSAAVKSKEPNYLPKESLDSDSDDEIRLKLPEFKKFDANKYLGNNDDSDYDDDCVNKISHDSSPESDMNVASEQRKLATDLAKKYLRSFSLDDNDEEEDAS